MVIEVDWAQAHVHARFATSDMYSRMFHFKILHNILYLNKALTHMQLVVSPLCSFCNITDETVEHVFSECSVIQDIWNELQFFLRPEIELGNLCKTSAYLGPPFGTDAIICHVYLIFKIFVYKSRANRTCSFEHLKNKIKMIRDIEFNITFSDPKRRRKNMQTWISLAHKF